jgi:hypothetical protein
VSLRSHLAKNPDSGVSLVVDGMEARNAGVTASAIQEIKINQNPYTAEYPRWSRRRIEVITKTASDRYHGTFNFLFRDQHLNARDAFARERPPEQRRISKEASLVQSAPVRGLRSFYPACGKAKTCSQSFLRKVRMDSSLKTPDLKIRLPLAVPCFLTQEEHDNALSTSAGRALGCPAGRSR